jgi:hypothetical protein
MRKAKLLWLFVAPLILFSVRNGDSAPTIPLSVEDLTTKAAYIIEGRVLSVKSVWNDDHSNIFSFVRVEIAQSLKGDFPKSELDLWVPGGVIENEDIMELSPELPAFTPQTNVVLFVQSNTRSLYPLVEQTQGAFQIQTDENSGQLMAVSQAGLSLTKLELDNRIRTAVQK